jgi:hypothetical protein
MATTALLSDGNIQATVGMRDRSRAMLPIILYNLVQHLVAGTVDRVKFSEQATSNSHPTRASEPAVQSRVN